MRPSGVLYNTHLLLLWELVLVVQRTKGKLGVDGG